MIPANTRIWIVAGLTDLRRGFVGLSAMVQTALKDNPFSGQVFVFCGRRGDLIKAVVVRWRWPVSVREATGARPLRVAQGRQRYGFTNPGAVVDVIGRH